MHKSIYLLSAGMFALGLDAYVVAGLLPGIAATYGVSIASAGLSVAMFTTFYALSAPVFATMLSNRPARSILCIALAVFTGANVASALAPTLGVFLISRAVAGVGAGVYSPLAAASAAALSGQERKGRVLGFILGGMSLGTTLGVPGGLLVADAVGWQGALWVVTIFGAVALAGIAIFFPRVAPPPLPSLRERLAIMHDGDVVRIVGMTFLISVASLGLYTYVAPMLSEAGISSRITLFLAAWGAGGIVGSFSIGRIVDRTCHKERIIGYIALLLLGVFLVLPSMLGYGVVAVLPFFLWGMLGWASQAPQQHSLLAAHPDHGAAAVALNSSANYLGSAAGAFLGGFLIKVGFVAYHLSFAAAVTVSAALSIYFFSEAGTEHLRLMIARIRR